MENKGLLSLGKFLRLSRTSRDTLHYYDKIGLLPPAVRGKNKFRYYSADQMAELNLIRTLRDSEMTLDEIKNLLGQRNPESLDKILGRKIDESDKKLFDCMRSRRLLSTLQKTIRSTRHINEGAVTIESLPQKMIVLGEKNDYSAGGNDFNALEGFYHYIHDRYPDLNLNYPVWGTFSEERIKRGDWKWPDRYYLYNPEGHDKRPAALYAVGYGRGGYGQTDDLYKRMLDYIGRHNFEICGDAYEEYPLNEICIADRTNYLIRVMITVREK